MTIKEDFSLALSDHKEELALFKPLEDEFAELRQIIADNFKVPYYRMKWWLRNERRYDAYKLFIHDRITYNNTKYLVIFLKGHHYIMGLGEIGDLKGKLYFLDKVARYNIIDEKSIVYMMGDMCGGVSKFSLEHKMTNVQFFSYLIKHYKEHLVNS